MARQRPDPIVYQQFQIGLKHLFGGYQLCVICFVILALICLNLSGNVFWVCLTDGLSSLKWIHFAILLVFAATIILGFFLARRAGEAVGNLSVLELEQVARCRVLIAFLSFPGEKDTKLISDLISGSVPRGKLTNLQFREKFSGGWRMLLEAIAYHLNENRLEKVVILPSTKTFEEVDQLKALYSAISDDSVKIIPAGDLSGNSTWVNGVNYEKATELRNCLHDVYNQLRKEGYMTEDIIVDITSGQKVCSSVATAMSLAAGRQFQYISTHDYKVKTFNISYQPDAY